MEFAEEWRKLYNPAMEEVRSGRRAWTILDVLHREGLMTLLDRYDLDGFDEGEIDHMNRAWHRLDPWPDAVPGLLRLKTRYVIAPCSNGNIALIVNMAKRAGLPWDVVLGAEPTRAYKPDPEAYLASCRMLDLAPGEVLMVAAHNGDLAAAHALRPADRVRGATHRSAMSSPIPTSTSPPTTSRISRRSSTAELGQLRARRSVRGEGRAEPCDPPISGRSISARVFDPRWLVLLGFDTFLGHGDSWSGELTPDIDQAWSTIDQASDDQFQVGGPE